jgi:hypothetical protein
LLGILTLRILTNKEYIIKYHKKFIMSMEQGHKTAPGGIPRRRGVRRLTKTINGAFKKQPRLRVKLLNESEQEEKYNYDD